MTNHGPISAPHQHRPASPRRGRFPSPLGHIACLLALLLATQPPLTSWAETSYTIRKGDTLYAIGKKYGVSIAELEKANRLRQGAVLQIGQKIVIPTQEPPPATEEPVLVAPLKEVAAPKTEGRVPEPDDIPKTTPDAPPAEPSSEQPPPQKTSPPQPEEKTTPPPAEPKQKTPPPSPDPAPPAPKAELVRRAPSPTPVPKQNPPQTTPPATTKETMANRPAPSPSLGTRRPADTGPRLLAADDTRESEVSYLFLGSIRKQLEQIKVQKGRWRYIVVHHSGTKQGNAKIFDRFHRYVRGWEYGLAYHFVIGNGSDSGDGEVELGERWLRQIHGGHVYSAYLNEISIGICFVGDFNQNRPTPRQAAALIELVNYLRKTCGQPRPKFVLHREINPRPTDCPGGKFPAAPIHKRLD